MSRDGFGLNTLNKKANASHKEQCDYKMSQQWHKSVESGNHACAQVLTRRHVNKLTLSVTRNGATNRQRHLQKVEAMRWSMCETSKSQKRSHRLSAMKQCIRLREGAMQPDNCWRRLSAMWPEIRSQDCSHDVTNIKRVVVVTVPGRCSCRSFWANVRNKSYHSDAEHVSSSSSGENPARKKADNHLLTLATTRVQANQENFSGPK